MQALFSYFLKIFKFLILQTLWICGLPDFMSYWRLRVKEDFDIIFELKGGWVC
jgi:hypothetical protein